MPLCIGDGLKTINVSIGAFSDTASNTNNESVVFEWNFDSTSPTISIVESVSGSTDFISSDDSNITLVFTASEYTNDFNISDIIVVGGDVSSFEGDGTVFTCVLTPDCCEEIVEMSVVVNSGAFSDAATNANVQSNVFAWTYDISQSESFVTSTEGIIVLASGGTVALVLLTYAVYYMLSSGPVPSTSKPTDLTKSGDDGIDTTFSSNEGDVSTNPLHTL